MELFKETLDPSEIKDFVWDWSDQLSDGEAISSGTVTSIEDAGTTQPNADTHFSPYSRIWLTGGNDGERAIFLIRITTNSTPQRTLEVAVAIDVVDSQSVPVEETDVTRLTREIKEAKAQRAAAASGNAVVEVQKDGRRVKYQIHSLSELNKYIDTLERELSDAQADAGGRPRRRAISLGWRN